MNSQEITRRDQSAGAGKSALGIVLADGDDTARAALRAMLGEIKELRIGVFEQVKPPIAPDSEAAKAQLLMVALGADAEKWTAELQSWLDPHARRVVIAVVANRSPQSVRMALRAGAEEVILLPIDRDELARCLVKISETHPILTAHHPSLTCSLVSVAGGVGVTTLTAEVGLAIRRMTGKQVGLIDLALQTGALSAVLDLEPEHTIGELVDSPRSMDSIRLESMLTRHESGLCLLAAPKRLEEAELVSPVGVTSALTLMRELFDFVVVDCGHDLTESTVAAWQQSDFLLYVIEQSVTSIRPAQRFLDLFERMHLKGVRLEFVLNRFDPAHPISLKKIETALQRPVLARIPRDDPAFVQAQLAGDVVSVAAPESAAAIATEALTRKLFGLTVSDEKPRGLFGKLFASGRARGGIANGAA
ncbi:MAG TPA: AAA family ATPase [Candidatus Acidoferrales bacterium]|nr:AAA family ATPase [Candidatus Acidoferrales bacterium]